jgi:ribosome-binding factor A
LAKIVSMWKIPELVFYRDYEIDQQNEMKQLFNDIKKREKTLRLAREKLFSTKKN